jgi:hypothetical protein
MHATTLAFSIELLIRHLGNGTPAWPQTSLSNLSALSSAKYSANPGQSKGLV